MKTKFIKGIISAFLLMLVSEIVSADTQFGYTLGSGMGATDVFQVNCFNDGGGAPIQVYAKVRDRTSGTNALTLTIVKAKTGGLMSANSTTDVTGSTNWNDAFSRFIILQAGTPTTTPKYFVVVTKDSAPFRIYDINVECQASGNYMTGTNIRLVQNQ